MKNMCRTKPTNLHKKPENERKSQSLCNMKPYRHNSKIRKYLAKGLNSVKYVFWNN